MVGRWGRWNKVNGLPVLGKSRTSGTTGQSSAEVPLYRFWLPLNSCALSVCPRCAQCLQRLGSGLEPGRCMSAQTPVSAGGLAQLGSIHVECSQHLPESESDGSQLPAAVQCTTRSTTSCR